MYPIRVIPGSHPYCYLYWGDPFAWGDEGEDALYLNTYWSREEAEHVAARIQAAAPGDTVDILHGRQIVIPAAA
jgi:hypothetical protein